MLSSLSHDARTPLTAMRAAVEALQDGMATDPDRYLDSIEHDLRAIEAIVENLFVISKIDADQLCLYVEEMDLVEVAAIAVGAIEPLAQKHGVLVSVESDGPVPVQAARAETERMINNLLTNSIRHSPRDGQARVVVDAGPKPTLSVSDDGPGFDTDSSTRHSSNSNAQMLREREPMVALVWVWQSCVGWPRRRVAVFGPRRGLVVA
jgi:signal transduction histidine kinase